jgi:RNA polymerase sigma-70 factor (ECF subfamily)
MPETMPSEYAAHFESGVLKELGKESFRLELYKYITGILVKLKLGHRETISVLAEDITQETLLKALKNIDQLREREKCAAWTKAIAENLVTDHLRTKWRKQVDLQADQEFAENIGIANKVFSNDDELRDVQPFIAQLSPDHQEALLLFLEGYTYPEMEEKLGVAAGTLKSRVHEARKQIKELIAKK